MGFIGDLFGSDDAGDQAATASLDAAQIAAGSRREALDYLKEREQYPRELFESSTGRLAGIAGLPGGEGSQQELVDRAQASPLYGALVGGREAGEDAILRRAAATGGLRSGNVQEALYDYNTQLENQALLQSYNQELGLLQSLAGVQQSDQSAIANQIAGIGQTEAQGIIGAAQARQDASAQGASNFFGLGNLGIGIAGLF